jgi:putative pyruvate formate lyase activating enzyme
MMNMPNSSYLELLANGELQRRVKKLNSMLANCVLCPHQCKVNRLEGERGYCKTLENVIFSGGEAHFGEEEELVGSFGSGTIFFGHCNLKCVFCQNYELSQCGDGYEITPLELSKVMLSLQKRGCHNINFVSPSHIVPQIVEALYLAAQEGLTIPIVYNTGGYDLTDTLKLLEGIVDIYMPDIKFSDDDLGQKYLNVRQYYSIASRAVQEMYRQVGNLKVTEGNIAYRGLLIRHLVMPENLAGTDKIMQFIGQELSPETYVNIMAQYYPAHLASQHQELNRRLTRKEYKDAVIAAERAGLNNIKTQRN